MEKKYLKDYYHFEREHWWYRARMEILKSCIEAELDTSQKLKILNVGTATGATNIMLQQFGDVTSVEYDEECCQFVNSVTNLNVQQGDITQLEFKDNSFDLVCSFDVIEHIVDDQLAADELVRVCNKEGYVFVTTPAF